jgi:hypothetical protein
VWPVIVSGAAAGPTRTRLPRPPAARHGPKRGLQRRWFPGRPPSACPRPLLEQAQELAATLTEADTRGADPRSGSGSGCSGGGGREDGEAAAATAEEREEPAADSAPSGEMADAQLDGGQASEAVEPPEVEVAVRGEEAMRTMRGKAVSR